jgi:LPXTG-motif cell wall-anchored protein
MTIAPPGGHSLCQGVAGCARMVVSARFTKGSEAVAPPARRHLAAFGPVLVVLSMAWVLAAGGVAVAQQQYPPTSVPSGTLVVNPTVEAGSALSISGDACGANLPVTITFNGTTVATATTDAGGHFQAVYTVPAGTPPGSYTVTATTTACVLSAQTQVLGVTAARLAFTGSSDSLPLLWIGGGLALLGVVFTVVARRRRSGAHAR